MISVKSLYLADYNILKKKKSEYLEFLSIAFISS